MLALLTIGICRGEEVVGILEKAEYSLFRAYVDFSPIYTHRFVKTEREEALKRVEKDGLLSDEEYAKEVVWR